MPTWANRGWYASGWLTESRTRAGKYTARFATTYKGGVYAWYGDGRLLYIGCSESLSARVEQYFAQGLIRSDGGAFLTPWGQFAELDLKVRQSRFFGDWATAELRLIRRLKPVGNVRSKHRYKALAKTRHRTLPLDTLPSPI